MGGDNVRWCEEMGKFVRVFIGRNDNLVCIYHKCGKKNVYKWLKTCKLNVENLTKVKKTFVLQF